MTSFAGEQVVAKGERMLEGGRKAGASIHMRRGDGPCMERKQRTDLTKGRESAGQLASEESEDTSSSSGDGGGGGGNGIGRGCRGCSGRSRSPVIILLLTMSV